MLHPYRDSRICRGKRKNLHTLREKHFGVNGLSPVSVAFWKVRIRIKFAHTAQPLQHASLWGNCPPVAALTQNDGGKEAVEEELSRELGEEAQLFLANGVIGNDSDNDSHDDEHARFRHVPVEEERSHIVMLVNQTLHCTRGMR